VPSDLSRRRALLTAALGFALVDTKGKPAPKEVQLVREWLDTWTGIGHVVTGMARQDYDLELARYDGRGWGATFYVAGMEHSLTSRTASAWEPTPWRAVQVAAWGGAHEERAVAVGHVGRHHPALTCRGDDSRSESRFQWPRYPATLHRQRP
jgi:hypothetical protein